MFYGNQARAQPVATASPYPLPHRAALWTLPGHDHLELDVPGEPGACRRRSGRYPTEGSYTSSGGGALTSYVSTLDVRDSSLLGNQVIGSAGGPGWRVGKPPAAAIEIFGDVSGYLAPTIATFTNCVLSGNTVVGGAGGHGAPGGTAVGGALDVNSDATVTLTGAAVTQNQVIGGAGGAGAAGGEGMGGACSVGTAVLFGSPDASSLTINGSGLDHNQAIGGAGG